MDIDDSTTCAYCYDPATVVITFEEDGPAGTTLSEDVLACEEHLVSCPINAGVRRL